jgi:hypothetical protein
MFHVALLLLTTRQHETSLSFILLEFIKPFLLTDLPHSEKMLSL